MAEYEPASRETRLLIVDRSGHPFGLILVHGGSVAPTVHFTVIVLDNNGVSWYYWPSSSGALRKGVTEPTYLTQDTAGAAV